MRLSYPRLAGYALGALGTGVFTTVPTVLLLYFCTETLEMPPTLAAAVVFAPKIWALFWDPLVGIWSDRTRSPIGRRRPFLLAGTLGVPLAFFALFAWPYPHFGAAFPWVAAIYFLLTTVYSLFAVPFIAIPAEISADPAERERVAAWRIGCAMIGTLIGAGLAPLLVSSGGGGREGYIHMAAVVSAICCLGMASAFFATPPASGQRDAAPVPLSRVMRAVLGDRPFRRLAAAYVVQLTGVGIISSLTPYWVVQLAGRSEGSVGVVLAAMLGGAVLSMPLWAWGTRRFGAHRVVTAAALAFGAVSLGFLVVPASPELTSVGLYALIGLPFAGLQVGPFALAAHLTYAATHASGLNQEGLFTGAWTASEKLGLALGPGVAGLGLALVGFRSGTSVQSEAALTGLSLLLGGGPAAFVWVSLLILPGRDDAYPDETSRG